MTLRRRQRDVAAAVDAGVAAGIYVGGPHFGDPSRMPFASPWSTSNLEKWVYQDMFGEAPVSDRATAMSIPAYARGSVLMGVQGAKQPLVQMAGETPIPVQPHWITHTGNPIANPFQRMRWSIDDLINYPATLWLRNKPGDPYETREHVNWDDWEIDADLRVLINGTPANDKEIILICGPHEGVLNFGRDSILDIRGLYRIVSERIKNPAPQLELHDTEGVLSKGAKDQLLADWREARQRADTQGVAYTSSRIEVIERGVSSDSQLMIEARNAAAVDIARMIGHHAGNLDATTPKASLNYETQSGRNQEFTDIDLDTYLVPIAARLSEDDVCTPGERVAFNVQQFTTPTPAPTGPALED